MDNNYYLDPLYDYGHNESNQYASYCWLDIEYIDSPIPNIKTTMFNSDTEKRVDTRSTSKD